MGAVILRAQTCMTCGGEMPTTGRVDRRYCKGACRTLAYRLRRRVKATAPPGPLKPQWAEPSDVVKTMLTSLAQIQARVLDFAHQLESEELYSRRPVRTPEEGEQVGASRREKSEPGSLSEEDDESLLADEDEEEPAEQGEEDVIGALRSMMDEVRTEALKSAGRAAEAEAQTASLRAELSRLREHPGPSAANLQGRVDELSRHRDQFQSELLAERERGRILQLQLQSAQKEATDAHTRLKQQRDHLQRENEMLRMRVHEQEAALQRANSALAQWDQIEAQSTQLTNQSRQLQLENSVLRAEIERLRPPAAEKDPLVVLMKERAKALHWLAVFQQRARQTVTGRLLPSYDEHSILGAAIQHAFEARRDFYFRPLWGKDPKPLWVYEDRLLDPESERRVCEAAVERNKDIVIRLDSARIHAGDPLW